jgi:hypothetical protein
MPKLGVAVAFLYWTIRFLFDENFEVNEARKKGSDFLIVLVQFLRGDAGTLEVRDIFL